MDDWALACSFLTLGTLAKIQCDQVGLFSKDLGSDFLRKIFGNFFGYFEKYHIYVSSSVATFRHHIKELGYILFQHLVTLKIGKMYKQCFTIIKDYKTLHKLIFSTIHKLNN